MTSFPYHSHPRDLHLSTPSPTESPTLHGEGIWRQASHSNLDQEQAPGIPTPPNLSPLSGSSSVGLLPLHASLPSPDNDLRASSRSQLLLPGSPTTMRSTAPTVSRPVQSGVLEHEWPPAKTTHRHQAQPKDTGPGTSVGLRARLLKVFRAPFRALFCIPIRPAAKRPGHTASVSPETFRSASFLWHVDSTVIQNRRQSRNEGKNGGDVQPQETEWDPADGEKAIPTTTPNHRSTPKPWGDTSAGPPKTPYGEVSRHYRTIWSNPSHP